VGRQRVDARLRRRYGAHLRAVPVPIAAPRPRLIQNESERFRPP